MLNENHRPLSVLVALGSAVTFLHASWVEEKARRAKSTSVGGKSDRAGDAQAVTVIGTDAKTAARLLKAGSGRPGRFVSFVNFQGT